MTKRMSLVPFEECLARPPSADGSPRLLKDHLLQVAESLGFARLPTTVSARVRFLAGLLHDGGKARSSWQAYIRGWSREKVNHSPLGSALFFFAASRPRMGKLDLAEKRLVLELARDIYDHHGALGDLTNTPPWAESDVAHHASECDLDGLFAFVDRHVPGLALTADGFATWECAEAEEAWGQWYAWTGPSLRHALENAPNKYRESAGRCIRLNTAALILPDRLDAAGLEDRYPRLEPSEALKATARLDRYCEMKARELPSDGTARDITELRKAVKGACVARFVDAVSSRRSQGGRVFTLILPTGMGKTMTSTRIALEACRLGLCERLVYVAPYLSILSQATSEIEKATGLPVLEHHHLSIIGRPATDTSDMARSHPDSAEDDDSVVLEAWSERVVTTTFNQLFRALFPTRAQHTMRLNALRRAMIVVDEPQVIDFASWSVFLTMIEAAAKACDARVLLSTATLPPLEPGLSEPATPLAPERLSVPARYAIEFVEGPWDESVVAEAGVKAVCGVGSATGRGGATAVVMNTVADAYRVYERACELLGADKCLLLTGCMTGPHKAARIQELRHRLKRGEPTLAVCTQIVECGVDLSFASVFRALPVTPALIQCAGRANRHGELARGQMTVFRFCRAEDGKDARGYVYRPQALLDATDICVRERPRWSESESEEVLARYYQELMTRAMPTARLDAVTKAAVGEWSALAGVDPFGSEYPHVSVFVPFGVQYLEPRVKALLDEHASSGPEELYDKYLDKRYRTRLSFTQRKQFMAVLQHFVFPLDVQTACGRVSFDPERPIGVLTDASWYRPETGAAHLKGKASTESADDIEAHII